jgi:hypothetical protein
MALIVLVIRPTFTPGTEPEARAQLDQAACGSVTREPCRHPDVPLIVFRRSTEQFMKVLVWLGIAMLVAWGILWLGIKMAVGAVHLLLVLGLVAIAWGLLHPRGSEP